MSPASVSSKSHHNLSTTIHSKISVDHEIDEKMKILNDIKKLQNQILVSDKVSLFLKKFDRKRTSRLT